MYELCPTQVKVKVDPVGSETSDIHLSELRLFSDDDNGHSTSGSSETLFFVMPNTSGLVAGCKVSHSVLPFGSVFLASLL